jgi:hypothetical protein
MTAAMAKAMKRSAWLQLMLFCWPLLSIAAEWQFSTPAPITKAVGQRIFHHLEPAGRRSIAYSGDTVAVTWEDNRDGTPRVYLARKKLSDPGFTAEIKISGNGEAFDPVIVGLGDSRFMLAWEEDGQVLLRMVGQNDPGSVVKLSAAGSQPSISRYGADIVVVWSEQAGRYGQIQLAQIAFADADTLTIKQSCTADVAAAQDEQLYPAVTAIGERLLVSWEDRRLGHTIIMAAQGKPCDLTPPRRISAAIEQRSATYGKGHGVSRVALATFGADRVLATWADKRDFREGYDIYAAVFRLGTGFGPNMRVQDDFGGVARQWHPTAAGHPDGSLLVAWTDEREGNSDIMISVFADNEWGEDIPVPGASGAGEQAHPSIIFDDKGQLHIIWIERDERNGPTRLKYMMGTLTTE